MEKTPENKNRKIQFLVWVTYIFHCDKNIIKKNNRAGTSKEIMINIKVENAFLLQNENTNFLPLRNLWSKKILNTSLKLLRFRIEFFFISFAQQEIIL